MRRPRIVAREGGSRVKQRDLFISHASEDAVAARELRAELEGAGYTCWMAPDDVVGSRPWAEQILAAIDSTRVMVVLISRHANDSVHVSREVNLALGHARAVLPVRIESVAPGGSLEYLLSLVQHVDAFPPPVSMHTGRIRRMIDALLDNSPEDEAKAGAVTPAVQGVDAGADDAGKRAMATAPKEPDGAAPELGEAQGVRAGAVAAAGDLAGPGRRAASSPRARVALAVGAGAVVLVGLAIIGAGLASRGAAPSSAPSSAAAADQATPSPPVTATPSQVTSSPPGATASPPGATASPPGATASPSPVSPTPGHPSASAALDRLSAAIPESAGSCGDPMLPDADVGSTWIVQLVCSSDSSPTAVAYFSYALYADIASLRRDYDSWRSYYEVRSKAAGPCTGGKTEEGSWSLAAASSKVEGRYFCGHKDLAPVMMWTDEATNILAEIQGATGADPGDLYSLWSSRRLDPIRN